MTIVYETADLTLVILTRYTTDYTTDSTLQSQLRSNQRSDSDVDVVSTVSSAMVVECTNQTTVIDTVIAVRSSTVESGVVDVDSTRSLTVLDVTIEVASDSSRVKEVGNNDINICQLQVLDSCSSSAEQRSVQTLDEATLLFTTVELVCAEALDWFPIVAGHIDISGYNSLSAWVEYRSNASELDKSLLAVDLEYALSISCVSLVSELRELTNRTCVDRLLLAAELNGHLLVSLSLHGDYECTVVTSRNSCINSLCLCAEYQWLCESYGCSALRTLSLRSYNACCAINSESTSNPALLSLDLDAGYLLAITLDSKAKNTCEVLHCNFTFLSCIAIHWRCCRSKSANCVSLLCEEEYRISSSSSRSLWLYYLLAVGSLAVGLGYRSRVTNAVRRLQIAIFEYEACISLICLLSSKRG